MSDEDPANRPRLSLPELVNELVDEQDRLDSLASNEDELSDVRAAFSWSYGALSPRLQRSFRLLGLNNGGDIGLGAIAGVLGTDERSAARDMRDLAAAHLVQEVATSRYRLHDLLRTYARELLSAEDSQQDRTQAVRRLLSWYLLATDSGRVAILPHSHAIPLGPVGSLNIPGFDSAEDAMRWFDQERMNLLAALDQAMELGQYDIAWKLPVVADGFFELRSHWADWREIHRAGVAAARTLGDGLGEASNLLALGDADWRAGRLDTAVASYRRTTDLAREMGDRWLEGFGLRGLGLLREEQQDIAGAAELFRSALEVFRSSGIRRGEGMALLSLARSALAVGDLAEAALLGEEAVTLFLEIDDRWSEAWGTLSLAAALVGLGRGAEAVPRLRRAVETFDGFQDQRSLAMALALLGDTHQALAQDEEARVCWLRAAELYESLGDDRSQELRTRLGDDDDG